MDELSKAGDDDAVWKYSLPESPRASGMLEVTGGHSIYWHEYGNAKGTPVMFLHGGPGGGTHAMQVRVFDPKRYRIILFDQRGCGKSTPNAGSDPDNGLKNNTLDDLIEDVNALRKALNISARMHLFGGSWGSTFALAYAIRYPQHVKALILRGIFLCRLKDLDFFYRGNVRNFHLDPLNRDDGPGSYDSEEATIRTAWKHYVEVIPLEKRGDMVAAYNDILSHTPATCEERATREKLAKAWIIWEAISSYLKPDWSKADVMYDPATDKEMATIEAFYFVNGAFLGGRGEGNRGQNFLLENIHRITHLPMHIVQGKYDRVCPPFGAHDLLAALKDKGANPEYIETEAGHSMFERETVKALTGIMDRLD